MAGAALGREAGLLGTAPCSSAMRAPRLRPAHFAKVNQAGSRAHAAQACGLVARRPCFVPRTRAVPWTMVPAAPAQPSILPALRGEQLPANLLRMTGPAGHLRHHGHGPVTNGRRVHGKRPRAVNAEQAEAKVPARAWRERRQGLGSHAFARVSLGDRAGRRVSACLQCVCTCRPGVLGVHACDL